MSGLDPWAEIRSLTQARIGLARSGHAVTTSDLLDFQAAHAQARDAVQAELDSAALMAQLGPEALLLDSAAPDRQLYLQRPDLGRRLSAQSRTKIPEIMCDAVFVVADGLSAVAVAEHAAAVVQATRQQLPNWTFGPTVLARQARVAIGDEIAAVMGARAVIVLIGERPGLSSADSLGAYLTYEPQVGRLDSERNCISNIRPPLGLSIDQAARTLAALLIAARRRGLSGTRLKEDAAMLDSHELAQSPADLPASSVQA